MSEQQWQRGALRKIDRNGNGWLETAGGDGANRFFVPAEVLDAVGDPLWPGVLVEFRTGDAGRGKAERVSQVRRA
jgi:hypothetical protein